MDSDSDIILIDSDGGESISIECAAVPKRAGEMDGDDGDSLVSSASAPSVARGNGSNIPGQNKVCGSIVDVDARIDLAHNDYDTNSSSSSSSSGIPSPGFKKSSKSSSGRPPSIIHMKSPTVADAPKPPSETTKPAKKKCLTNCKKTIHTDELSCTDMSTTSSLSKSRKDSSDKASDQSKEATKPPAKQRAKKKRQWGKSRKKAATKSTSDSYSGDTSSVPSSATAKTKKSTDDDEETANKHFHCYLLRSLDPDHPLMTYIGFTTHPQRRIRQHNGILKAGGARRTKRSGRPWTFVCVIHGFQDKITALQFEWAWQNVNKSKGFREAVGDDALAKKMKRRYGPKARLEELRILLKDCLPFSLYSLTVYFPEREYYDIYRGILRRGKNGNPYKKDDDESDAYEPLIDIEVCSLENMPFAREIAELKEKKKAKREELKAQKQKKKTTTNDGSDISEYLDSAKSMLEEESCWSNFDDSDDDGDANSNCSNQLKTIEETNSSVDLCDSSTDSNEDPPPAGGSKKLPSKKCDKSHTTNDVDDISKDLFSLSIGASKKHASNTTDECDFSTISSADSASGCSLDNGPSNLATTKVSKRAEKENQQPFFDGATNMNGKTSNTITNCDVVDLCDSP